MPKKSGAPCLLPVAGLVAAGLFVVFAATRQPTVVQQEPPTLPDAPRRTQWPSDDFRPEGRVTYNPTTEPVQISEPKPEPAPAATEAPEPQKDQDHAASQADAFVERRAKELVAEMLAGVPSSAVTDDELDRLLSIARVRATREWRLVDFVSGLAADRIRLDPEHEHVYRAAASETLSTYTPLCQVQDAPRGPVTEFFDAAVDRARLGDRLRRR